MIDDVVERAPALLDVAANAADETNVRVGVDEHLDIAQVANAAVREEEYPVDDDHLGGGDADGRRAASVRDEIVLRFIDRLAAGQRCELRQKKIPIERVRVIPVDVATFLERQMRKVAVIAVHVDESHRDRGKRLGDVSGDGGFA